MTSWPRRVLARFLGTVHWPFFCFFASTVFLFLVYSSPETPLEKLATVGEVAQLAALGATLAASVYCFATNKRALGAVNLALFGAFIAVTVITLTYGALQANFGEQDHFADDLEVPKNLQVALPTEYEPWPTEKANDDAFQNALLRALDGPGSDDPTVVAAVTSLEKVAREHPELLRRYLATSPAWRVFTERGQRFATRRWKLGSDWHDELHGYYSSSDLRPGGPQFQSRVTIGLSHTGWVRNLDTLTKLKASERGVATLTRGNGQDESLVAIDAGPVLLEIFEQSGARERRLTRATLEALEREFAPLAAAADWAAAQALLPADSVHPGKPSLALRTALGPGIYGAEVWVNPGEEGWLWLKAFEVTRGTSLSVERLAEASNERVGWSSNPDELFFSNTRFTIYEGSPNHPYAARFEVWFKPDAGGPERKLLQRVFAIEGWQR